MKNKEFSRLTAFALALLTVLCALSSCRFKPEESNSVEDGKITVAATSFPLYDIVRQISDESAVNVVNIRPGGADGHDFDPSVGDVNTVAHADLFVYCGDTLEAWAKKLADSAGGDALLVDVSADITLLAAGQPHGEGFYDDDDEHIHGADPHIWTSPKNMLAMSETVYSALEGLGAADSEKYQSFKSGLDELDSRCENLASLQSENGKTLFFGDTFAFLYLTDAYGFKYISAYPGCSDDAEPSIASMSFVSDTMKKEKASVIFKAERSEGKAASSIASDVGAQVITLHSCHNITKAEISDGVTYISLMTSNLDGIEKAVANQ